MAYGQAKQNISIPAGEDLKGKEFHLVGLDGKLATAGAIAYPLDNDAAELGGEPCALTIDGVSQVYLGGTVARGDALAAAAGGEAVKATAGDQVIGYALEDGADGTLVTMLVVLNGAAA